MDLGIVGRRALVAASSSGLGLATARALVDAGCSVVISGRNADRLATAASELEGSVTVVADVSTPAGAEALVTEAIVALGGVDILVTNAGGPPPGRFADTDVDQYAAALDLNLMSVVAMCKAAVPPMQERGWGRVVAITSISVRQPIAELILSNTARSGATAFLKTMASEVAGDGVTVNSVQPGYHATARLLDVYGPGIDELADQLPTKTVGDADDFGRVCAFLCSESAKFITGVALPVDGGINKGLQ
jgi:3-oxoacyl-[acyl-carrier protein] reductase